MIIKINYLNFFRGIMIKANDDIEPLSVSKLISKIAGI